MSMDLRYTLTFPEGPHLCAWYQLCTAAVGIQGNLCCNLSLIWWLSGDGNEIANITSSPAVLWEIQGRHRVHFKCLCVLPQLPWFFFLPQPTNRRCQPDLKGNYDSSYLAFSITMLPVIRKLDRHESALWLCFLKEQQNHRKQSTNTSIGFQSVLNYSFIETLHLRSHIQYLRAVKTHWGFSKLQCIRMDEMGGNHSDG